MALPRSVKVKRVPLVSLAAKFLAEAVGVRAAANVTNEQDTASRVGMAERKKERSGTHTQAMISSFRETYLLTRKSYRRCKTRHSAEAIYAPEHFLDFVLHTFSAFWL